VSPKEPSNQASPVSKAKGHNLCYCIVADCMCVRLLSYITTL